jgi:hypothetical protein
MSTMSRARLVLAAMALVLLVLSSCSEEGDADGTVLHECVGWTPDGTPCDFTRPCERFYDGMEGRCGHVTWSCVDGRFVTDDQTGPCSFLDDGGGIGEDGGDDAGGESGETVGEDGGVDEAGGE